MLGFTDTGHHAWLLYWCWGSNFHSSWLYGKHSIQRAKSPARFSLFLKTSLLRMYLGLQVSETYRISARVPKAAEETASWQSACLACGKAWIRGLTLKKKNTKILKGILKIVRCIKIAPQSSPSSLWVPCVLWALGLICFLGTTLLF